MKPTDEQVRTFWKWCGFYIKQDERYPMYEGLYFPDGTHIMTSVKTLPLYYPSIDLNNLFKWAVPKTVKSLSNTDLSSDEKAMRKLFSLWLKVFWKPRSEPISIEDALFWAIWEVIQQEKT